MSAAFEYRPRFKDIRVKPPKKGKAPPGERTCEWDGCGRKGDCRAPKAPDRPNSYFWFCQEHAAEYNKNWDFFAGMNDTEIRAFQESAAYGHRPTWTAKAAAPDRDAAAQAKREFSRAFSDTFGVFGDTSEADKKAERAKARRRVGSVAAAALDVLGLAPDTPKDEVGQRYRDLVKQMHPDTNGGDRSMEEQLQRVIRAYKTLKTAGLG
ncbi:MAG: J domain-containing protein [Maricaulaceae bacterium]